MTPPELDSPVAGFLRRLGASEAQVAAAIAGGHPSRLALDLVLSRNLTLSTRDVAELSGVPLGRVAEMIHAMGLPMPDPDESAYSHDDVELFRIADVFGTDLAHVLASSINRIADAGVSSYVQEHRGLGTPGGPVFADDEVGDDEGDTDLALARDEAAAGEFALALSRSLGSLFIHVLRESVRWQRAVQDETGDLTLATLAVGFVDLVGFTSMSGEMSAAELKELVTAFESTAFDLAVHHGGRVVKHIGDEVMFVTLDAATGVRLARSLIEAFTDYGIRPRGGLAFGELLALYGDYYGSIVNLAARLTDEAIPGELLVDVHTAEQAGRERGLRFEPAGRRMLKGFADPVATCSLIR